jgi:signal transduction histidine kinase
MRADTADMRAEIGDMRAEMARKDDIADLRGEIHSLRADVASDLVTLEKRLSDQIVGLRRSVVEYHSSAIGHGVLISELEERLRRVEQHLNLPPSDTH